MSRREKTLSGTAPYWDIRPLSGLRETERVRDERKEEEKKAKQKVLEANPAHDQSFEEAPSFLFFFIYIICHSSFVHCHQRTGALAGLVVPLLNPKKDKVRRRAWRGKLQDVPWTVWCHTWINLFSGRQNVLEKPPSPPPLRSHCLYSLSWKLKLPFPPWTKRLNSSLRALEPL